LGLANNVMLQYPLRLDLSSGFLDFSKHILDAVDMILLEEPFMRRILLSLALLLVPMSCFAQLGDILKSAEGAVQPSNPDTSGLSTSKITAGLKEALQVSTGNAVARTGKPDGFLKNEAIKILLPAELATIGKGMRMMGMGAPVDELEVGMNRAAEQATPKAKAIFLSALKRMTFDDARKILTGGNTAATEYFKRISSAELTTAFSPIVHQSMENVGVVKKYDNLMQSAPEVSALTGSFDLDKYVVGKTLDGLFYMLGQEEQKIRKNPAAQTTNLLKEVFGRK
jgi:Protein of unknown function (DUF4197)